MCWFHMKKAYEDLESFTAIKNPHKENIRQDIYTLQLSESKKFLTLLMVYLKRNGTKYILQLMNFLFILIKFGFISIQDGTKGLSSVFQVLTMDWNQIMVK